MSLNIPNSSPIMQTYSLACFGFLFLQGLLVLFCQLLRVR